MGDICIGSLFDCPLCLVPRHLPRTASKGEEDTLPSLGSLDGGGAEPAMRRRPRTPAATLVHRGPRIDGAEIGSGKQRDFRLNAETAHLVCGQQGHFVLGHIDGVGIIKKIEKKPKEVKIWFEVPKNLSKFIVKKGSIAIDGISLTVVDIKKNKASVCLIPHTMKVTNFHSKKIGDKLNIETDILGKYILKQT